MVKTMGTTASILWILCFVGCLHFGVLQAQNTCSQTSFDSCIAPVTKYLALDNLLKRALNANITQITAVCIDLVNTITCIDKTNCIGSLDSFYELKALGVRNFVLYACNEGKQDISQYQKCFSISGYSDKVGWCISDQSHTGCSLYQTQLNCLVNITKQANCATETVVTNVYTKIVQPEMAANNLSSCILNIPSGGQVQQSCNNKALDQCLAPVQPYFLPWAQPVTTEQIETGCRTLNTAITCVDQNTGCRSTDNAYQVYWQGYKDSLSYICGSGKPDFQTYQSCFDRTGFLNALFQCASLPTPPNSNDSDAWCKFYKSELNCFENLTTFNCTTQTAVKNFYTKLRQPRINILVPGCLLTTTTTGGVPKFHASITLTLLLLARILFNSEWV